MRRSQLLGPSVLRDELVSLIDRAKRSLGSFGRNVDSFPLPGRHIRMLRGRKKRGNKNAFRADVGF